MVRKYVRDFSDIAIDPKDIEGRLNFNDIFGRKGPVELEIGSGKGTFLLAEAQAFPEKNFLGIEWANKYYKYAVDRLGRWSIPNVRLVRTDAAVFLRDHVPDGSIQRFHMYFPDPWPKKKHHKRRFFCDENLIEILRILEPNGIINIATDHADYFEQMTDVAEKGVARGLVEKVPFIRAAGAIEGEFAGTNYERKYKTEGRVTNTMALRKI